MQISESRRLVILFLKAAIENYDQQECQGKGSECYLDSIDEVFFQLAEIAAIKLMNFDANPISSPKVPQKTLEAAQRIYESVRLAKEESDRFKTVTRNLYGTGK